MKRLISLAVSLLILGVIYWQIDTRGLVQVFQQSDRLWLTISLGMVVPLTLMTGWRLQQLMPHEREQRATSPLPFWEANRLILVACVLNMVLPSKMGDIAKAYFMRDRGHLDGSLAVSLVVFEKACDLLSLLLWCALGLVLYPQKGWIFWGMTLSVVSGLAVGLMLLGSRKFAQFFFRLSRFIAPSKTKANLEALEKAWETMHAYFWGDRLHLLKIVGTSILIWFFHLLQIWFFISALKAWTPFLANLALAPLAILAGLLPLTFAGVGTRDAAIIAFYQPFLDTPTAAALGILCTSRYLLPAIAGLPFLGQYLRKLRRKQTSNG
jgi:uncharacterized protein (TIRG00374 family)